MSSTELHLALNHFPILGTLLGILVLVLSLFLKNKQMIITALSILLFSGLMALPVAKIGENAEHAVEEYPGVSEHQIHEHEESAETAVPVSLVMSLLAGIAIFFQVKSHPRARIATLTVLLIGFGVFILMAQVAHEGGKIRRPDLRTESSE